MASLSRVLGARFRQEDIIRLKLYLTARKPWYSSRRERNSYYCYPTTISKILRRSWRLTSPAYHIVLEKVARRVDDDAVLWLLKLLLDASGKQGVPQGGVISPLLSNLYLNEVDQMLERAKEVTRYKRWTAVEYARFADDLVILVDSHPCHQWLRQAVEKWLREELAKL